MGRHLIGLHAAVVVDSVLWGLGTATGLLAAAAIPYLMFTRHRLDPIDDVGKLADAVSSADGSAATVALISIWQQARHSECCCSAATRCSD